MQTSNPVFASYRGEGAPTLLAGSERASFGGILLKTALGLAGVATVAAAVFALVPLTVAGPLTLVSALVALVAAFVVASRRTVSPLLVGVYAVVEGVFLGCVSLFFETVYPGLVVQAVLATGVVALLTLAVYSSGKLRVSSRFRKMVGVATLALVGLYLVNLVLSLLGVHLGVVETGGSAGPLAWVVSLVAVCVATFNLVIDFDDAKKLVEAGAPESEEWKVSFGLLVTLIWLYVELLRVLSYLRR